MTIEEKIDKLDKVLNTMIVNQMTLVDRVDNIARIQLDKLGEIESKAQLRDNTLRESFGGSFEDIYNYLAGINMKQMDIKAYSKRIEEKVDKLFKVVDILATRINGNIHRNQDSMDRIEKKVDRLLEKEGE